MMIAVHGVRSVTTVVEAVAAPILDADIRAEIMDLTNSLIGGKYLTMEEDIPCVQSSPITLKTDIMFTNNLTHGGTSLHLYLQTLLVCAQ